MSNKGKVARRVAVGGLSIGAGVVLGTSLSGHEGGPKVPVNDPSAKVGFRLGGTPLFKPVRVRGAVELVPENGPGKAFQIHETRDGGLYATNPDGRKVSMDVPLPLPGPHAAEPDFNPDSSEPAIQYTPETPPDTFYNWTIRDGKLVPFNEGMEGEPITIQQDGHGGLIAMNAAGELMQLTVHLPTPDANGQYEPLHPAK